MDTDATYSAAELEAERQRLIAELLAAEGLDDAAALDAPIASVGRTEAPLGYAQELLWLVERMHPGVAVSNIPELFDVRGALDVAALRAALADMVARHASLRTAFVERDGAAVQQVLASAEVPWTAVDLRGEPAAARAATVARVVAEEIRRPFDFARAPLMRATLLQTADDAWTLLLVQHHLVCDGLSRDVFFPELSACYAARRRGERAALPATPLAYADYVVWQRERAGDGTLAPVIDYWRERLHGAADVLELPTDRPRPAVRGFAGASESVLWPATLHDEIRRLGQAHGATLFMTMFAAYQALLGRYSGQDDFIIGSPVGGRTRTEMEGVIGYFANMVPLRTDLAGDPSFVELLQRVRATCLGAFEQQDAPFEVLVQQLGRPTSSSHTPLFQTMFALQKTEFPALRLDGADAVRREPATEWSTYDLWLTVLPTADGLRVSVEYRTDLFERATIGRLLEHLRVLVSGAVAEPTTPVSRLPLMTEAERDQVLRAWNATDVDFPAGECVHTLFEAQAARTPDAVAVLDDQSRLTYAELDARANRLAHHLAALGVGRGALVGLAVPRSVELMVALLGVMKAGAAYVPLDPDYPADRLAFMLRDSGARVLVTQEAGGVRARFAAFDGAVVTVDGDRAAIERAPATAPAATAPAATPDDLAYVIYTSGSTGTPKGTMLPHRAVVNYLQWMQSAHPLGADDCVIQKAPVSFDASVWELYLPLIAGARLFLARPDGHRDPGYLFAAIAAHRVNVVQFVPSLLAALLEPFADACPDVRLLFLGGEALPGDLAARLRRRLPSLAVHNLYGPTECAVYATAWALPRDFAGGVVPIGRPIANDRVYVLGRGTTEPVPVGVPGELCIAGRGVGAGYLHRPELTAAHFVRDPFRDGPDARMYRTGDLARWRADGVLEFLGRIDHQIKIRGFRVELGEIESALGALPGVGECVVVQRGGAGGEPRLVAYAVPVRGATRTGAALDGAALRAALAGALPDHMVPATVVVLDAMPLNANGKLDRRALPEPADDAPARPYVAPRTPLEETVAAVWAEVLGRDRVSVDDDFFALGGHSLLGMRILARLGGVAQRQLPFRLLFEARTVAALAAAVERELAPPADDLEMEEMLAALEQLSDEDALRLLSNHSGDPLAS